MPEPIYSACRVKPEQTKVTIGYSPNNILRSISAHPKGQQESRLLCDMDTSATLKGCPEHLIT